MWLHRHEFWYIQLLVQVWWCTIPAHEHIYFLALFWSLSWYLTSPQTLEC